MRWVGHVARIGRKRNGKSVRKETTRKKKKTGGWIIRWILERQGWLVDMGWIDLGQNRGHYCALGNAEMNLMVPQDAGEFLSSCTIVGFSKRADLHGVMSARLWSTSQPRIP
jgi:hypothetical protein